MSSIFSQLLQQEHDNQKKAVEQSQDAEKSQVIYHSESQLTSAEASKPDSYPASVLSSYPDSTVEFLRKAVRYSGKEAFFGRFTPEEKGMLKEIAYTYQRIGIKTTENEIARVAVNLIVADYKLNKENSLLGRVLKSLHV